MEGEAVFAFLPHEVEEEDDHEVVVGADQAAEEAHHLSGCTFTRMERQSMSILWLRAGSNGYDLSPS